MKEFRRKEVEFGLDSSEAETSTVNYETLKRCVKAKQKKRATEAKPA